MTDTVTRAPVQPETLHVLVQTLTNDLVSLVSAKVGYGNFVHAALPAVVFDATSLHVVLGCMTVFTYVYLFVQGTCNPMITGTYTKYKHNLVGL